MKKELSATMVACIDLAQQHGGELVRFHGGFWAPRGLPHPTVSRSEYHSTPTVEAIVARGAAEYSEWKDGRGGRFPIAFKVTQ